MVLVVVMAGNSSSGGSGLIKFTEKHDKDHEPEW